MNKIRSINSIKIKHPLGNIVKLFSKKNLKKFNFGEIYISKIKKNKIKGWHYHFFQTSILILIEGKIKIATYVDNKYKDIIIDSTDIKSLIIPPKTWYAFQGIKKNNIVMNLSNKIHNSKQSKKSNIKNFSYKWKK